MTNQLQKTFYTAKVYVIYEPDDFRRYLRDRVAPDWGSETAGQQEQFRAKLGLEAWGTVMVYRARLILFDFRQQLFEMFGPEGQFRNGLLMSPLSSRSERQAITFQLAIEVMTARREIQERVNDNPYRARLIYDTLHFLGAFHEIGRTIRLTVTEIDEQVADDASVLWITPNSFRKYLSGLGSDASRADEYFGSGVLFSYLFQYVRLLADPARIEKETIEQADRFGAEQRGLRTALARGIEKRPVVKILMAGQTGDDLVFTFSADRYGYSPEPERPFDLAAAVQACGEWLDVMKDLFGDLPRAWELAATAGLTPLQWSWPEIEVLVEKARSALEDGYSRGADAIKVEIGQLSEQFGWILRQIEEYGEALQGGFQLALLAALAVPDDDGRTRRMTGLKAVARLFRTRSDSEFRAKVAERTSFPQPAELRSNDVVAQFEVSCSELQLMGRLNCAEDPGSLPRWAEALRRLALHPALFTRHLELAVFAPVYWSQYYEREGLPERQESTATLTQATLLDVLHAAAHGGVPVMPARGSPFSIGQLSRIWLLHEDSHEAVPDWLAVFALENLSNPGRTGQATNFASITSRIPSASSLRAIVVLSLLSADSPAWFWRPTQGVLAMALMPPDTSGASGQNPEAETRLLNELQRAVIIPGTALRPIEAVEADGAAKARGTSAIPTAYFGFGAVPVEAALYIPKPSGIAPLADGIIAALRRDTRVNVGFWRRLLRMFGLRT